MKKKCFKCNKTKNIYAFYRHKQMTDGHLGKCKECAKKDATEHRNKNIEKIRKYDRIRATLPHRKRLSTKNCQAYRIKYPLRFAATTILSNAIRSKKIEKPKRCSMCNKKTRIMGHHEDYYKPLNVIWVCQVCHKGLHKS